MTKSIEILLYGVGQPSMTQHFFISPSSRLRILAAPQARKKRQKLNNTGLSRVSHRRQIKTKLKSRWCNQPRRQPNKTLPYRRRQIFFWQNHERKEQPPFGPHYPKKIIAIVQAAAAQARKKYPTNSCRAAGAIKKMSRNHDSTGPPQVALQYQFF